MAANERLYDWVVCAMPVLFLGIFVVLHYPKPDELHVGGDGQAANPSSNSQSLKVQSWKMVFPRDLIPDIKPEDFAAPGVSLNPDLAVPSAQDVLGVDAGILAKEVPPMPGDNIPNIAPVRAAETTMMPAPNVPPQWQRNGDAQPLAKAQEIIRPKTKTPQPKDNVLNKINDHKNIHKTPQNIENTEEKVHSNGDIGADDKASIAGMQDFDQNQFFNDVKAQLARHKIYPKMAQRRRLEGRGVLELLLDGQGQLVGVRVVESTKHDILDSALLEMAHNANPYPAHGQNHVVGVTASVRFQQ